MSSAASVQECPACRPVDDHPQAAMQCTRDEGCILKEALAAAPVAAITPLNEGVRRGIEDARDTAARNVEYLDKEIAKAEREQDRLTERIAEMREELARNAATLDEAEEMLNGR